MHQYMCICTTTKVMKVLKVEFDSGPLYSTRSSLLENNAGLPDMS